MRRLLTLLLILTLAAAAHAQEGGAVLSSGVSSRSESAQELYERALSFINARPENADLEKGFELLEKSAEAGNVEAKAYLGAAYMLGGNVEKNLDRAVRHLSDAAEKGAASAQYNLALCYENGLGVERDVDRAAELMRLSAQAGNAMAKEYLEETGRGGGESLGDQILLVLAVLVAAFVLSKLIRRIAGAKGKRL